MKILLMFVVIGISIASATEQEIIEAANIAGNIFGNMQNILPGWQQPTGTNPPKPTTTCTNPPQPGATTTPPPPPPLTRNPTRPMTPQTQPSTATTTQATTPPSTSATTKPTTPQTQAATTTSTQYPTPPLTMRTKPPTTAPSTLLTTTSLPTTAPATVPTTGATPATTQPPPTTQCPTSSPTGQPNSCLFCNDTVQTINVTLDQLYCTQPLYTTMITNGGVGPGTDNTCLTMFPIANNPGNYFAYQSSVLSNGTVETTAYTASPSSCGAYVNANNGQVIQIKILAYLRYCNTFISCIDVLYGDVVPYCFTISSTRQRIGRQCLQEALSIMASNSGNTSSPYLFPMNLPPGCITQQSCYLPSRPCILPSRCVVC